MMTHNPPLPFLSRMAYDSGYYLSYGVVFPAVFLVHIIPGGRALTSGFVDGAVAARKYVDGLRRPGAVESEFASRGQSDQTATALA
jgi:hypothetical protein